MVARVLAVAAIATVALAGAVSAQANPYTFCERYTGIVFGNATDPTQQGNLVNAVVTRAALGGGATGGTAGSPVGLFNDPLNQGFFNGTLTPFKNYADASQSAALTALVLHLNQFFGAALGCRAWSALNPWDVTPRGSMRSLHANMNINSNIMTSFIGQVAGALASYGVPLGSATDRGSELYYATGLFSAFNRYPTEALDAGKNQICSTSDCPLATQMYQFILNADGSITNLAGGSNTITVNSGDYINFRFNTTGTGLTRASSSTATDSIATAAAGTTTYTVRVTPDISTNGAFYWYNNAAPATGRVSVTLAPLGSSSSGSVLTASTGSSAATGTGNGAGATASLGFAAVAAVVAAAAFVVA